MCGPDTQKGEAIAGESGFNGLRSHIRESRLLSDGLRDHIMQSGLLWNGLRAGSGLWDGLRVVSRLWVTDCSQVRRSHVRIPGTQNGQNIEGKDSPLGHGRTNRESLFGCDRGSGQFWDHTRELWDHCTRELWDQYSRELWGWVLKNHWNWGSDRSLLLLRL